MADQHQKRLFVVDFWARNRDAVAAIKNAIMPTSFHTTSIGPKIAGQQAKKIIKGMPSIKGISAIKRISARAINVVLTWNKNNNPDPA